MNKEETYALIEKHYRENQSRLVKTLSYMMGNWHNAEETVQETYTRACEYWYTFSNDDNFNGWINTILSNCLRDKIGEENRHGMAEDPHPDIVSPSALNKLHLEDVKKAIEVQETNIKRILSLFFFSQLSVKDIANVVTESSENIRKVVERFRKQLRETFKGALFEQ